MRSWAFQYLVARVIRKFYDLDWGWGDVKLQVVGVGKINGCILELKFAGQIINSNLSIGL